MSVKKIENGFAMDFTLNGVRYRERINSPHNKSAQKRIIEQEAIYKMAITIGDKTSLKKYPNSGIIQKAFHSKCTNLTVNEYSNVWFGRRKINWSHTTIRGYNQKYNTHIGPYFGSLLLTDFTTSCFNDWAKNQAMSGKTMNDIRNILSQILDEAFYDEVIETNPMKRTRPSKKITKEPEPFNNLEIQKILEVLESPMKEYFQLAFFSGLRTGELIALRWMDVDFKRDKMFIRRSISNGVEKEPKTKGSIRNMDLHPLAKDALNTVWDKYRVDSYRVFVDPKTDLTYKNAEGIRKYIWSKAIAKSGVKYRCPYQTRHTFASIMLSSGKNIMWVANQMGHSNWGMLVKVYGRWIDQY
ncbi:MAG: integrase [Oleiphilaceae bacterium]|jgi:integrase